jgi:two-component system phosphate regulon sensor histidine kinase PhoR
MQPGQRMIGFVNALKNRTRDSIKSTIIYTERPVKDTLRLTQRGNRVMQFLYDIDELQDSIKVNEIDTAFNRRMQQQGINVPFTVSRIIKEDEERNFGEVSIGFANPVTYKMSLSDTFPYLLKRLTSPILLSIFIVGFTIFSFVLLYRNLLKQKNLSDIKNEFISNITHELKTPIATVSVAIEALRSFNASMDANRTKEYLDISANELQRLSLLVDKVLKLSMFENREIELKYETLNMKDLVEEVLSSMKLQFEKHGAVVNFESKGSTTLEGDRLHLVSVIFNLVDNAIKYSAESPVINIISNSEDDKVSLIVGDGGIGVPTEYKEKIFEKFFRVPTGNLHNAKGYGLGLSYVYHVIKKHHGTIKVESEVNNGSKFIISIPKTRSAI